MPSSPYESWSREQLIARLQQLDSIISEGDCQASVGSRRPSRKSPNKFDISSYLRRKIALKFYYSGWEYNGLVFQGDKTRLPTVEGTLYDALASCRLIDGEAGPQACGWERCGRTDVGVSSAAQVVSLWIRSNIGQQDGEFTLTSSMVPPEPSGDVVENISEIKDSDFPSDAMDLPQLDASEIEHSPPSYLPVDDTRKRELRYVTVLNRVLPPSIRVIAWSPVSSSFSARFNCLERHYKYFFSLEGLNLDAMRDAAARLVGEHDFRNLCKLDPAKQITNFKRKITRAEISFTPVLENGGVGGIHPSMCVLDLVGNAFLYNQVRHIVAILFLVGVGLEPSSVMTALLNADPDRPEPPFSRDEPPPELVSCKPEYQMADPLPLVLWECAYDEKDVKWQTDGSDKEDTAELNNLYRQMSAIYTRSLVHSTLHATFLKAVSRFHSPSPSQFPLDTALRDELLRKNPSAVIGIPLGGGATRRTAAEKYTPILMRKRLEHVDVVNERWRKGKGQRRAVRQAEVADVGDE